jgi:hypothetical protein
VKTLLITLMLVMSLSASAEYKMIQHPSLRHWTITIQDLRYMYSFNKQYWSTGELIRPVMLPWRDPAHKSFVRDFLDVTPSRLRKIVEQRVNQGVATGPVISFDSSDMLNKVSRIKGAIGYGNGYMLIPHDGSIRVVKILR